jgi:hypothetical protein
VLIRKKSVSTPIGSHKKLHDITKAKLQKILIAGEELTLENAVAQSAKAHNETFRKSNGKPQCRQKCIEAQLNDHFKKRGTGAKIKVRRQDGATTSNYDRYRTNTVD